MKYFLMLFLLAGLLTACGEKKTEGTPVEGETTEAAGEAATDAPATDEPASANAEMPAKPAEAPAAGTGTPEMDLNGNWVVANAEGGMAADNIGDTWMIEGNTLKSQSKGGGTAAEFDLAFSGPFMYQRVAGKEKATPLVYHYMMNDEGQLVLRDAIMKNKTWYLERQ